MEAVSQYWLFALFGGMVAVFTGAIKLLYNRYKRDLSEKMRAMENDAKEQELLKEAVLALLHDRLYQSCQFFLHRGFVTVADLDNLKYLYKGYHALGGNGTGTELFERCMHLPIRAEGGSGE